MKRLIICCALVLFWFSSCDSPMRDLSSDQQPSFTPSKLSSSISIPPGTPSAKADSIRKVIWQNFRAQNGQDWNIRWSKTTGLPVSLFSGLTEKAYPGNPEQAARAFLSEYQTLFGFASPDQLRYIKTQTHRGIRSITFQQYYKGVPVQDAEYKVHIRDNGKIDMVNGYYYPNIEVSVTPSVSANVAIEVAKNDLNLTNPQGESNKTALFVLPKAEGTFALMWKVSVLAEEPSTDWLYYIDAYSGKVIRKVNQITDVTGTGELYPTSSCLSSVSSQNLYGLYGNGYLDGSYLEVFNSSASRAYSASNNFVYSTSNTHFDEVSLYYHVDNFRRSFIENLDADNDLFNRLNVYAHNNSECPNNACYSGGDLYFSDTYDFAREDKIVHHEYSHAVIDHIQSGIDSWDNEEGAISEGTPDYFAGSFTGRSMIGDCAVPLAQRNMANPDITSYSQYESEEPVGSHDGGEFFSAILWDLRGRMNAGQVDFLVYDALYRVTDSPNFLDFRDAIMAADDAAYSGDHHILIQNTFADWDVGDPVLPLSVDITGPSQVNVNQSYTWTANASGGTPSYTYFWYWRSELTYPEWDYHSSTQLPDHNFTFYSYMVPQGWSTAWLRVVVHHQGSGTEEAVYVVRVNKP